MIAWRALSLYHAYMNQYSSMTVLPTATEIVAQRRAAFEAGRPEAAPSLNLLIAERMRRDRIARGVPVEGADT